MRNRSLHKLISLIPAVSGRKRRAGQEKQIKVLFVCTENLCRSPMAEGVLRQQLLTTGLGDLVIAGSAGTITTRQGAKPDPRAQRITRAAGIDLGGIRATRIDEMMLIENDFVFAMDRANLARLMKICPDDHGHKISLLLDYFPESGLVDIPDPYFSSYRAFEEVFVLIDRAVRSLVVRMQRWDGFI